MKKQAIIDKDQTELLAWKHKYLRALADYQNLEKRINAARDEESKHAAKEFFLKILPVVDDLEKASKNLKNEGLELILNKLSTVFESMGIKKLKVVGEEFDPYKMECLEPVNQDSDYTVIEELRSGYELHNRVVRPAQVKLGKGDTKES